jgi:hypothetical protein
LWRIVHGQLLLLWALWRWELLLLCILRMGVLERRSKLSATLLTLQHLNLIMLLLHLIEHFGMF